MADPRIERIAFQMWWKMGQTAGECTLQDLSDLTGASPETCRNIAGRRGWSGHYRRTARGDASAAGSNLIAEADGLLDALDGADRAQSPDMTRH